MTMPDWPDCGYVSPVSVGGQCPVHYQPLGTCCQPTVRYAGTEPLVVQPPAPMSHPSDIVRVRDELRQRAKAARAEARAAPDRHDSPHAAALRGKAKGYGEGADLLDSILSGGRLGRKWRPRRA